MKKTDIAMIVLIAGLAAGAAYLTVSSLDFLKPPEKPEKVDVADAISTEVKEPSPTVFNKRAINPTVKVTIGEK